MKRMLWTVALLGLAGCFDWSSSQKRRGDDEPYPLRDLPFTEDVQGSHSETSHFVLAANDSITVEVQAVLLLPPPPEPPMPPEGTPRRRHRRWRLPPPPPKCGTTYGVELVRARDAEVIAPKAHGVGSTPAASSWSAPEEGEYYLVVGAQHETCKLEGTVKVSLAR
jgi:hypothetical protein